MVVEVQSVRNSQTSQTQLDPKRHRDRRSFGTHGEELATQLLVKRGYTILERQWRSREGEIDIIAVAGGDLVAVEVKTRGGVGFGTGEQALTAYQLRRIQRAVLSYRAQHPQLQYTPVRVDLLAITVGTQRQHEARLFQDVML
ncbi:YraN family protein [Auritidibacter ignavus]|nr:YraN family protein [Auritidibacter ignavus]RMX24074.1 YraN family protein [Auritidibacter ignavus]